MKPYQNSIFTGECESFEIHDKHFLVMTIFINVSNVIDEVV